MITLLLSLLLHSSVFSSVVSAPAHAKTLNYALSDAPATLDWNGLVTMVEAPILAQLCEGLFTYSFPSGELVPGIAESVSKSLDHKTYTFKIRADAKWSDGRSIYAQDFVDSWLRLLSPQSTSLYSYYLFEIENAKEYHLKTISSTDSVGIKATDDRTLVVKLKTPNLHWEAIPTFWPLYPIRKDRIEKYGENWWRAGILLSSGPFVFDSYEQGKKLILKRNPFYKRFRSNVDEIDMLLIDDPADAFKKYEAGIFPFLDFIGLDEIQAFSKRKDFIKQAMMKHYALILNAQKFPMNDLNFRAAIFHSIDLKTFDLAQNPLLKIATTLIPQPLAGSAHSEAPEFSVVKAKKFLDQSGVLNNKKLKVTLLTSLAEPYLSISKMVQTQISKNTGVQIDLSTQRSKEYSTYLALNDYDMIVTSWTGKVPVPEDFLLPYSSEATNSRLKYTNPEFDQLIQKGIRSAERSEAQASFSKAQALYEKEDYVLLPLVFESMGYLQRAQVHHLYFNHMGIPVMKDVELLEK